MGTLFSPAEVDGTDERVIGEIQQIRRNLQSVLRTPKRWVGGLRRTAQAWAIQGSNTIEGYAVSDADAVATVDRDEPLTADQPTWAEILGYRRVLTYVNNVASYSGFTIYDATLNAMHFMLLEHDLAKSPGRYRSRPAYLHDRSGRTVYEGPDPALVPALMRDLVRSVRADKRAEPMVRAAMAHLNLAMIHPYRGGNGRMARALQTMVLGHNAVLEPTFASIEEWLGQHTDDYSAVLAATGGRSWQPDRSTRLWLKFNLRAHHLQAQP